jgi:hypothetical protein
MRPVLALYLAALLLASATVAPAARKQHAGTYMIPLPAQGDYSSIGWLVGQWSGTMVDRGRQGKVLLSVSYALGRHFLLLREEVSLAAVAHAPGMQEGMMGILSPGDAAKVYHLTLYSSHGFVMKYLVTAKPGEIDLNPAGGPLTPSGWLFRRVIRHSAPGQCTETVDAAPPGEGFFRFYTAKLSQAIPGANAASVPAAKSPQTQR